MPDGRAGKRRAQTVEHRLIGDLAGEAHIAGRDRFVRRHHHQRAAPLRGRAGQMCHAMGAKPGQMIGDRLAGAGKDKRRAAADRAQINLQTAVTANIVERAPDIRRRRPGSVPAARW